MSKHQPGLTIRFWLIVLGISILGTLILGTSSWSTLPGVLTTACAQAIDDPSGVVVAESPDYGEFFCETPSIIVLKNGHYLISQSYTVRSDQKRPNQTNIFLSKNKGVDWEKISTIDSLAGASFALKDDDVYLIGSTKVKNGQAAITVSSDNGVTWSDPLNAVIHPSKGRQADSAAVLIHNDRIWRSYSSMVHKRWAIHLYWAPYNSDWLAAQNWSEVGEAAGQSNFRGTWSRLKDCNPVPIPQGIGLVARCVAENSSGDISATLPVSKDGKSLEFDPVDSMFAFPGGANKFTLRYDAKSKRYWAIVNKQKEPFALLNRQVLVSSNNLRDWKINSVLYHHLDYYRYGKHDADWVIDGEDLITVSLAAWQGAVNSKHPTHTVFDRIRNFRETELDNKAYVYSNSVDEYQYTSDKLDVTGKHLEIKNLAIGMTPIAHRKSNFTEIPSRLQGWKCVCTHEGRPSEISVTAKVDCELFMITDLSGVGVINVSDWTREPELLKVRSRNEIGLFSRQVKKGEVVELPQGTWGGSQLLLPPGY